MFYAISRLLIAVLSLLGVSVLPAQSAGVVPFALTQQVDQNGRPLIGCLFYVYVVGTTATPQQIYGDFGLTLPLPNPLQCDNTGRLPSFYLADGQVHVRLTNSGGLSVLDIPVLQVIGPSAGGGGGGGTVDPNAIFSTGDYKWRASADILSGWVRANAQTVGSATSGATGRANADTQALYVYLWNNCPDAHCPVTTGRGATGLADFNANKALQVPDMRSRSAVGLDTMGNAAAANRLLASNVTSGGGDGINTPNATGGESNHTQLLTELALHTHVPTDPGHIHGVVDSGHAHVINDPSHTHGITDPTHVHNFTDNQVITGSGLTGGPGSGPGGATNQTLGAFTGITINGAFTGITNQLSFTGVTVANHGTNITIGNTGSSTPAPVMDPFMLGTWYIKL